MFDTLTSRFETVFTRLRGRGRLSADDVDAALREIRVALIEADVNLDVVAGLTERIRRRAVGEELSRALNPAQQVVKIVLSELTTSLGGERLAVNYASEPPTVVLLAGLQGSGKTTNAAKLAQWFLRQGRSPLLVGADLQRPAAVEQLRTLGERAGVPVFSHRRGPVKAASASRAEATRTGRDVVIVDTAGRLAIDSEMMDQVRRISVAVRPHYTFLVVDATAGQDAVNSAKAFHDTLALDGVVLTKLDGDARGGAALSVKEVVGRPIAFASVGEKLEDFEPFHPDRLASRILGMGDVETLIDKAESAFEAEQATETAARLLEGTFTFDDFLATMQQVLGMGNLRSLMGMMPGVPRELRGADVDEGRIGRITGMIHSMTPQERAEPDVIDASRRQRIAAGSGCRPSDVKALVDQFKQMRSMMKGLGGLGGKRTAASRARSSKQASRPGGRSSASKRRGAGGRTTPKGPVPASKAPLTLPGLEKGEWPGLN
ncbi:MAG: signal recognition particle protein [Acidimicrobiaceae bacterium]|nr:signal recognition particle protein [Acidimicrobiaceae bacterium]MYE75530.1 signal recognition particle protein [Acidimicrobiaceae bacterium]MYH43929.1 signal recognition particle protein [Acidimicrobiaceae bacterium]MYJ42241.1 signal recognition particle protein [Acidimicrobiaceae bacterium]MYK74033.1 signal recognition particle protein [Acidimicrobiaceae bacterium]